VTRFQSMLVSLQRRAGLLILLREQTKEGTGGPLVNVIERARSFVQGLQELGQRTLWDWKRCPHCGSTITIRNGSYTRRPWTLSGRIAVRVQRHWCYGCDTSYSETSPALVRGSWYGREVHRLGIDCWMHARSSLRRTVELLRSWIGQQERWTIWFPWLPARPKTPPCRLSASTLHRWLDRVGQRAQAQVPGQMQGIPCSQLMNTDGLWTQLRGGVKRVVLLLGDSVTGLLWPPVVAEDEESYASWKGLFLRAEQAGLELWKLKGLCSDGAWGLKTCLYWMLPRVEQARCVWHLWRNLGGLLAQAASRAAAECGAKAAKQVREQTREELTARIHEVLDASSLERARAALIPLQAHRWGEEMGQFLEQHLRAALLHTVEGYAGLGRVGPEWRWRDYRQRVSRGRNHGSEQRQERAALLWSIYHNFTPAQRRKERKRHYRYPGQSPLAVAGVPPDGGSYLDALQV